MLTLAIVAHGLMAGGFWGGTAAQVTGGAQGADTAKLQAALEKRLEATIQTEVDRRVAVQLQQVLAQQGTQVSEQTRVQLTSVLAAAEQRWKARLKQDEIDPLADRVDYLARVYPRLAKQYDARNDEPRGTE